MPSSLQFVISSSRTGAGKFHLIIFELIRPSPAIVVNGRQLLRIRLSRPLLPSLVCHRKKDISLLPKYCRRHDLDNSLTDYLSVNTPERVASVVSGEKEIIIICLTVAHENGFLSFSLLFDEEPDSDHRPLDFLHSVSSLYPVDDSVSLSKDNNDPDDDYNDTVDDDAWCEMQLIDGNDHDIREWALNWFIVHSAYYYLFECLTIMERFLCQL